MQKDNQLMEINQLHEQELFKLAAKSDASADLEQVLTTFISKWIGEEKFGNAHHSKITAVATWFQTSCDSV